MSAYASSPTLDLARTLIARNSVTPQDAGCLELIAERLAPLGFAIEDQHAFRDALDAFYDRVEEVAQTGKDVAASECLPRDGRWNALIGTVATFIAGAEWDKVSAIDLHRYADTGVNWRVTEGYGHLIAQYAGGLDIVLDCPVQRIDHHGRDLRIETARGTMTAGAVIVTIPSALMAQEAIVFTPSLPEKIDAAAQLPLGHDDKLFLSLDKADEFEPDSRLFGRTDRTGTGAYHMRPFGRPLIECYFGGSLAEVLERGGPQAFFEFAKGELVNLLGSDFARRIAPVAGHTWGADPFARGAYSYARPGYADCRSTLATPVDRRLFFAGEACSTDDFSTVRPPKLCLAAARDSAGEIRSPLRDPALRGVLIDGLRQRLRKTIQQVLLAQSGCARQRGQGVCAQHRLQICWRDVLVRAAANPGLDLVLLSGLVELVHEFAKSAGKQAADAGTGQKSAEPARQGSTGAGRRTALIGAALGEISEQFADLVTVLIARNRKQAEQGRHRRKSAIACHLIELRCWWISVVWRERIYAYCAPTPQST